MVLRRAIEINPKVEYYCQLSELLHKKGAWWQICDVLDKAIEIKPNIDIKYYRMYLTALRSMRKFQKFIEIFEKIKNNPQINEEDYFYYGMAFEEIGDSKKAKEAYNKAFSILQK